MTPHDALRALGIGDATIIEGPGGETARLTRVRANDYCLMPVRCRVGVRDLPGVVDMWVQVGSRARWGSRREIGEDVAYWRSVGRLPEPSGGPW